MNHSSFIYLKTDELKANEGVSVTDFAAYHCGIIICIIWLIEPKGKFLSQTLKTLVAQSVLLVWWNYESWGMGERRDFVPYFTASLCLNILYYLAYGTENEFKIILLRRLDGQQIYLTNFNLSFGHKLLSVKKNVNIFALKFKYCFI